MVVPLVMAGKIQSSQVNTPNFIYNCTHFWSKKRELTNRPSRELCGIYSLVLIDNNFEHFYTQQNGNLIQRSGNIAGGHYRPEGFIIPRIGDHPREQYPTDEMNQYVKHVALKIWNESYMIIF